MANPWHKHPRKNGRAEFYYVQPGKYYLRCFFDRNGDGKWTTGSWSPRRDPEEVYYFPKEIEVRANWDLNEFVGCYRPTLRQTKT